MADRKREEQKCALCGGRYRDLRRHQTMTHNLKRAEPKGRTRQVVEVAKGLR